MNPDPQITIVIPTYNEAYNLPHMADALLSLPISSLRLLIVDDNSPDGTGRVATDLAARHQPRITVLHRQTKDGLGTAYIEGMTQALAHGAEFVVQMDADFSHSPQDIPRFLEIMAKTGADVVVGSRYVAGGSLDPGWSWWRRLLSWWANFYSQIVLGVRVKDITAGFKLWKRETLVGIDLDRVRSNHYSFQVEMAYLCERLGYEVVETPIHFEDRRIGQSKLDVPIKLESAWRVWQIRWRHRGVVEEGRIAGSELRGANCQPPATSHQPPG